MKVKFRNTASRIYGIKHFAVTPYVQITWSNRKKLLYVCWLNAAFIFLFKAENKKESRKEL